MQISFYIIANLSRLYKLHGQTFLPAWRGVRRRLKRTFHGFDKKLIKNLYTFRKTCAILSHSMKRVPIPEDVFPGGTERNESKMQTAVRRCLRYARGVGAAEAAQESAAFADGSGRNPARRGWRCCAVRAALCVHPASARRPNHVSRTRREGHRYCLRPHCCAISARNFTQTAPVIGHFQRNFEKF